MEGFARHTPLCLALVAALPPPARKENVFSRTLTRPWSIAGPVPAREGTPTNAQASIAIRSLRAHSNYAGNREADFQPTIEKVSIFPAARL
jgi:hypothetical protein